MSATNFAKTSAAGSANTNYASESANCCALGKINTALVNRTTGNRTPPRRVSQRHTKARMSSKLVKPPDAITGMATACANLTVASMFTPLIMPSRPMSGVNNAVDAVIFKTFRQINHMMLGYGRPAVYRHHTVFGIQPDNNLPGNVLHASRTKSGFLPPPYR